MKKQEIEQMIEEQNIHEKWKYAKENKNYIVFESGKIASICTERINKKGEIIKKYRLNLLKGSIDKYGYITYRMVIENKKKHVKGHRIVANAFIDNPINKKEVNHINGIKTDNRVLNLEWNTRTENNRHAIDIGLLKCKKGKEHWNYKTKKMTDEQIYILVKYFSVTRKKIANFNNVSRQNIDLIIKKYKELGC